MRGTADRGAAAVEMGLLLAGVATALIAAATLMGEEIEAILMSALQAISGG